ncbi:hypothetical protein COU20_00985 [Candidatus Kaiserbacteria bacterium CG10_big_fil_rev_8_21_14_0_10_59_10]|uniref:Bacterial sugar transferase domain-containing protein n=1 Tax=Candidatus Kaiserbacteria bacterium CG10_big_fil_rev_8_21_14_0_10_59_10 TaxID=1974612 RepID=A0A2H0U8K8_9BACT|nr:MAG: hypothetical protein COU20_00985 [Candidatus Kaiserbacteria bacterium CG10_big_fil_rev_8_21_14_0_10_59_10]
MSPVPKREYLVLLAGDVLVFTLALWVTLALRYLEPPAIGLFRLHFEPFLLLFGAWVVVFFLAGLYGRHTKLFRSKLLPTILYAQLINVAIAALFFFSVPLFGIAPKTILVLYLAVSSLMIFGWRVLLFPRLRLSKRLKGVLIASGPDALDLVEEIQSDARYPLMFERVIDTSNIPSHEVIQQACRVAAEDDVAFLVVDFSDPALSAALPIVYDAAFQKRQFALVDILDLYEEVFERVPLSFMTYERVLGNLSRSRLYDALKRAIDLSMGLAAGVFSLVLYPFVALAIKLEDGGPVFISQERVGRYQQHIKVLKFRSMTGNDNGKYGHSGTSSLRVTRVGKYLRILRIDELPQLWNIVAGDLSFVGPRPELPALAAHYSARIPYYNARYLLPPGLTGWAQIRHDRHPHHGAEVAETKEKLTYDLYYLKRRSLLLDIYIILQTIRIVLTARGT